ncbi:MAG TPA: hypothetical protein VMF11_01230 [Candidatus Baltobacteraceae bacterium]|nr:hypothetical protein [Candidatus Baltobacteraceae bacterium]
MTTFALQPSDYVPLAIGFFGLATGYFIYGGQELFGFPQRTPEVDRSMGLWGIWMPGFMQFVAGTYIFVGLTWFQVFKGAPLYMAGLAFTAYGVHWFALGGRRVIGGDGAPESWMSIAFGLISLLGLLIFSSAGDVPVALIFLGLVFVYIAEGLERFGVVHSSKPLGFFHWVTGIWLMYCAFAATFNMALGAHWWL